MPFEVPAVVATKDVAGEGWGGVNKVSSESPSEGPWLHTGKNSRVRKGNVKESLFTEINIP